MKVLVYSHRTNGPYEAEIRSEEDLHKVLWDEWGSACIASAEIRNTRAEQMNELLNPQGGCTGGCE